MIFKQASDTKEADRPWQADIERLQQTLQEVLSAVSSLSGVELADGTHESQIPGDFQPSLDCKTLKDRIRNELETFATTTASEMARQAERQTRVALEAIHSEATGQVDEVARELREKLQGQIGPGHFDIGITQQTQDRVAELVQRRTDEFARWVWLMCKGTGTSIPMQIEKLLEPYVEEATGRLLQSFRERLDTQLVEQEQMVQGRLQGSLGFLDERISDLDQAAKKICEQNVETLKGMSADRLNSAADEAVKTFEDKIREQFEKDFRAFQARMETTAESLLERLRQEEVQKAGELNSRIAALESEVRERALAQISGRIERTAADAIESSVQHLHQQSGDTIEHSKEELKGFLELQMEEARLKINKLAQSVNESLTQDAERRVDILKKLDYEIVQGTLEMMKERIGEISSAQLEEIDKFVRGSREKETSQYESQLRNITDTWYNNLLERIQAEAQNAAARVGAEVKANADSVMQEFSDKVDASALMLRDETVQATSRIESTVKNSLQNYEKQISDIAGSRLEEHRQVIRKSLGDLQARLERSAQMLRQEIAGTLGPEPKETVSTEGTEPPQDRFGA
jgi:hypothetical protein